MSPYRLRAVLLVLACSASLAAAPSSAGTRDAVFEPVPPFAEVRRAALTSTPTALSLSGDEAVVVGRGADGRGHVAVLDATTLAVRAERELDVVPEDIVRDDRGGIFLVGTGPDGPTRVLATDADLAEVHAFALDERLVYPRLSLPRPDVLVVGSLEAVLRLVDVSDPSAMRPDEGFDVPSYASGVGKAWLDRDGKTLFVNLSAEATLVAFDLESQQRLGQIGYRAKSLSTEPFATLGFGSAPPCDAGTPSFLIADMRRGLLTLAEFDTDFRSLDILTEAEIGLDGPAAGTGEPVQGGRFARPSGLIASACDRSAVWVASRHADRVVQYAVNADYRSIERIGTLVLDAPPTALAVATDGTFALTVSDTSHAIARYEPTLRTASPGELGETGEIALDADESRAPAGTIAPAWNRPSRRAETRDESGDPAVRELQRLLVDAGYPLGSIDGVSGPATRKALELYRQNTGRRIGLDDIDAALKSLRTTRY